jgi:hypothetical protein
MLRTISGTVSGTRYASRIGIDGRKSSRFAQAGMQAMDFGFVVALALIASGVFRLWLVNTGKLPPMFGYQRYVPYVFIGVGVVLAAIALVD